MRNKVAVLIALFVLSGCYTPKLYEVDLDLNDLEVLRKQGELTTHLLDVTIPRPADASNRGPDVKIILTESVRIFFIPDDKNAGELGIEPDEVPFDPYQPPEWDESQPEWGGGK